MTGPAQERGAAGPAAIDADWAFARYEALRPRLPAMPEGAPEPAAVGDLSEVVEAHDAFLLDGYGVLNRGGAAVPGAAERVAALRSAGRRVLVLTNSATHETALTAARYRAMGFDLAPEEIVSSRDVAAAALARFEPGLLWGVATDRDAHLGGLPGRLVPLRDDPGPYADADAVLLLSADDWTGARQARLLDALARRPRPVVCANPDLVAPREAGLSLEPGHWAHDLADRLGVEPRLHGKPFAGAFEMALARLPGDPDPARVAMVGDTLHTDVLGAAALGLGSVLVTDHGLLAGRDPHAYVAASGIRPRYLARTT